MKKVMHFYWGNDRMSYMRYMTLYSFCKLNPDWRVILIENKLPYNRILEGTTEKQDKTEYTGKDYSSYVAKLGIDRVDFDVSFIDLPPDVIYSMSDVHISDILSWRILSEGRGAMADMDILFIKPLSPSINVDAEIGLICFRGYPQKNYIPVSFMYASKPNFFFKNTYKNALENYDPKVYESCGTMCIEEDNLEEIKNRYTEINIQQFDDEIVFPYTTYPWGQGIQMLYQRDCSKDISSKAVGIHWYGGAPLSQINNNQINDVSLNNINNTITTQMKEILCLSHNNR